VVLHSIGVVLYADTIAIFVFLFAFDVSRIVKLFAWQNLTTNVLKDLLQSESAGECRLGLNSAQSKVWSELIAKRSLKPSEKMTFTFWLIFGLSPDLRLGDSLSERLSQQVIMMCIHVCIHVYVCRQLCVITVLHTLSAVTLVTRMPSSRVILTVIRQMM